MQPISMAGEKYTIDRSGETWFLWQFGDVIKTGSLETILRHLEEKHGISSTTNRPDHLQGEH